MVESTVEDVGPRHRLSMLAWYASEGGRKCQWCGKYRKEEDLFEESGVWQTGTGPIHIDAAPSCRYCREKWAEAAKYPKYCGDCKHFDQYGGMDGCCTAKKRVRQSWWKACSRGEFKEEQAGVTA